MEYPFAHLVSSPTKDKSSEAASPLVPTGLGQFVTPVVHFHNL